MSKKYEEAAQNIQDILTSAALARKNSSATYSRFPVGAALEDTSGRFWTGSNVESSSYGLSMCAERVALFKALSEGERSFKRIAVIAGGNKVATPCGACRQLLNDYCSDIEVILYNPDLDEIETYLLSELIPHPFSEKNFSRGM